MLVFGVPTLRNICVSLLIEFRDCLGVVALLHTCVRNALGGTSIPTLPETAEDIGDTPLELMHPILLQCNAEQLASIQDGSREGGRDLHDALQLHWQRNFISDFGWSKQQLVSTSQSSGIKLASRDWRDLYESAHEAHRKKAAGLGARLRAMTQAEQQSKHTRHVEVIAPTRAFAKHKTSRQSSRSKATQQVVPARQRILSKLGLLHNKSLKHLVRIRPARALQSQPVRQPHTGKQTPAKQPHSSRQALLLPETHSHQIAKTSSARLRVPREGPQHTDSGARHDTARMQETALVQTTAVHPRQCFEPQVGLVEADIDWLPSAASSQTVGVAQPHAEQSWTVQYLEQEVQPQAHCTLSHPEMRMPKQEILSETDINADKPLDKHGTFAWVEDDISWS